MPRPTITVAIPSYNKEAYIRRAIESVLKNADQIDEIFVVDNSSTDTTFDIAKEYESQISCHRNETNIGMTGNFNRCIELCKTDWLTIFHADDEMLEDAISKYRQKILEYPSIGLLHADCFFIKDGDQTTKTLIPRTTKGFFEAGNQARSCAYGACSSIMVKMDAYKTLGIFIESMSTDVEMWARIASQYDVYSIEEPTVIYHVSASSTGPQSLINRTPKEIKADWDNLNAHILTSFPNESDREIYRQKIFTDGPGNYWSVLTANIRAHKVTNILGTLKIIIIDYRGLFALTRMVLKKAHDILRQRFHI